MTLRRISCIAAIVTLLPLHIIGAQASASASASATLVAVEPNATITISSPGASLGSLDSGFFRPGAQDGRVTIIPGKDGKPGTRRAENVELGEGGFSASIIQLRGGASWSFSILVPAPRLDVKDGRGNSMKVELIGEEIPYRGKNRWYDAAGTATVAIGTSIEVSAYQPLGRYTGSYLLLVGND